MDARSVWQACIQANWKKMRGDGGKKRGGGFCVGVTGGTWALLRDLGKSTRPGGFRRFPPVCAVFPTILN